MSKQLNRKVLKVNQRTGIKQEFSFNPNIGYKSVAEPSIVTWRGPAKGTQGESTNSSTNADKQIINRNWRPI